MVKDAWNVLGRRPIAVALVWGAVAVLVGLTAPDLTRLAAEGQSKLLGTEAESRRAAELVRSCWPEQAYESTAVLGLYRPGGLRGDDRRFAQAVARRFEGPGHPEHVLRVLGPDSRPEIAERLTSPDGTLGLVVVPLDVSYVSPTAHRAVDWLQEQAAAARGAAPEVAGLELRWTGDAIVGRDYMAQVETSLDRAAIATVLLLLVVLLLVYRSFLLALVPLVTIAISLIISRGLLAWLTLAGWEISPLVELFLVALLFGTGTDFCLFLSWRFAEHFNADNPDGVMRVTLARSFNPLVTSAGTILVGLLLMGTTRFKLFSTTGPSVALGLGISLIATLTLTPALLVLLARWRPRSFRGFTAPASGAWEGLGRKVMARPLRSWAFTLLAMVPLAAFGLRTWFVQDLLGEMPPATTSGANMRLVAEKFGPGMIAPLTVVLESDGDLRRSEGLALIDDVSRLLSHQRRLREVRSATQPLGSPEPLSRARLSSRLGEVNHGFAQLSDGAKLLHKGLMEGAAKLRAALWLEQQTGLNFTGPSSSSLASATKPAAPSEATPRAIEPGVVLSTGLKRASTALMWAQGMPSTWNLPELNSAFDGLAAQMPAPPAPRGGGADAAVTRAARSVASSGGEHASNPATTLAPAPPPKPSETLLNELSRAADGAEQISRGADRAHREVTSILDDPVGRRALDRLLITSQTVRDNPELLKSFAVYITPDGHRARIDVSQADRVFSEGAMDQVDVVRRRLVDYLGEYDGIHVKASISGINAESADIRALTHSDQVQSWFVVPIGVFLVLLVALRDPLACVNLVATMMLTYAFALGATHLVFVTWLGAEGIDWKVPYFLFVLLVAVGVDYNVFLMSRLNEETMRHSFRGGIIRAIGQTGGLISSAAAITACSFASFMTSPLVSLRQLGFALVVGITIDALLVRPLLVPCGHWLLRRSTEALSPYQAAGRKGLHCSHVGD